MSLARARTTRFASKRLHSLEWKAESMTPHLLRTSIASMEKT